MIELTDQQRRDIESGAAIRVSAEGIGEDLILLRASKYESLRESLEEQKEQELVLRYSMKQATKAARDNPY